MIKVTFKDGSVVEYPTAVSVSESADHSLWFLNGPDGAVIATLPAADVHHTDKL